jgi:hypothetical protein
MAKKKDKKVTVILPEFTANATQWYTDCPWCGYKSPCSDTQRASCSQCGKAAMCLPCGAQTE